MKTGTFSFTDEYTGMDEVQNAEWLEHCSRRRYVSAARTMKRLGISLGQAVRKTEQCVAVANIPEALEAVMKVHGWIKK